MKKSLVKMQPGERGRIIGIHGGKGVESKLSLLGIRPGERIRKVTQQFMHGPVVVEVERSQVALGFHLARRILIEVET